MTSNQGLSLSQLRVALGIATAAVFVGLFDLPYSYYTLLRVFLCGVSVVLLVEGKLRLLDWHRWVLAGFAVLYNPIFPVRLGEKVVWTLLNLATLTLFWAAWFRFREASEIGAKPTGLVLVVEDDAAVRRPLVKFLQMRQWTVVTAETAAEALDAIKSHRPSAAIVDMRLRTGSGREVILSIPPEVPVIIFSGLRAESADLEGSRPLTRVAEKPYSLVTLTDTLEDMLEEAEERRMSPAGT